MKTWDQELKEGNTQTIRQQTEDDKGLNTQRDKERMRHRSRAQLWEIPHNETGVIKTAACQSKTGNTWHWNDEKHRRENKTKLDATQGTQEKHRDRNQEPLTCDYNQLFTHFNHYV